MAAAPANAESNLQPYKWENRVLLLFGPRDSSELVKQKLILAADPAGLEERDMMILEPPETERLQDRFEIDPAAFTAILVGKDGGEKLRSDRPVSLSELYGLIDQMPMRRREMRQQRR
jgi:hypothetical protein